VYQRIVPPVEVALKFELPPPHKTPGLAVAEVGIDGIANTVTLPELFTVPPGLVKLTTPVVELKLEVKVTLVVVFERMEEPANPLILMALIELKFVPVTTTLSPGQMAVGVKEVIVGAKAKVVKDIGLELVL